jgi:hypothetical protein
MRTWETQFLLDCAIGHGFNTAASREVDRRSAWGTGETREIGVDVARPLWFEYTPHALDSMHLENISIDESDALMTPTQDIGLPLLLEIDPLSPLEASLAGVLGASAASLFAEPQGAKRRAKDEEEEEGGEEEEEEEGNEDSGSSGDSDEDSDEADDDDAGLDDDEEDEDDEEEEEGEEESEEEDEDFDEDLDEDEEDEDEDEEDEDDDFDNPDDDDDDDLDDDDDDFGEDDE